VAIVLAIARAPQSSSPVGFDGIVVIVILISVLLRRILCNGESPLVDCGKIEGGFVVTGNVTVSPVEDVWS